MGDVGLSASELGDAWAALSLDERIQGFRLLPEGEADEFFLSLSASDQAGLLLAMSLPERRNWLRLLMKDAVADVVHEAGRLALIDLLDEATRREVTALLTLGQEEGAQRTGEAGEETAALSESRIDAARGEKWSVAPNGEAAAEQRSLAPPDFDRGTLDAVESGRLDELAAGTLDLDEYEQRGLEEGAPSRPGAEHEAEEQPATQEAELVAVELEAPAEPLVPEPAPGAGRGHDLQIYRTVGAELRRENDLADGVWINLVNPSLTEVDELSARLRIEADFLRAALDEEERPRIEVESEATLIIVDLPALAKDGTRDVYTTIPLGIVLTKSCVVTVCLRGDTLLQEFTSGRVKGFMTQYRTRFVLQVLHRSATRYLQYLRSIDKASSRIEQELQSSMKNKELIQLLKLEKSLVYFSTSLKSNELVLEKLMRVENIRSYPEDQELLEDVIIENKQALEMANIYSNILSGTMDAFASIISNNLNIVMKVLTSVTIVMAIPTMVSSFFGMNVPLPLEGHGSFAVVFGVSGVLCLVAVFLLWRSKML